MNRPSVIVAHNHPSGDPIPSPEDVMFTEQIVAAGKLLDIEVLDHLIIGPQRFDSLTERNLGFGSTERYRVGRLSACPANSLMV